MGKYTRSLLAVIVLSLLVGCGSIQKIAKGTAITATTATAGYVIAGPLGGLTGVAAGEVIGEVLVPAVAAVQIVEQVDTVWGLLARLGEVAGWIIGALLLVPLLLGYLIPSPHKKKE